MTGWRWRLVVFFTCWLGSACGAGSRPASVASSETFVRSVPAGGSRRTFTVCVPPRYETADSLPMVVDLHGYTGSAAGQRANSGYFELHDDSEDGQWPRHG